MYSYNLLMQHSWEGKSNLCLGVSLSHGNVFICTGWAPMDVLNQRAARLEEIHNPNLLYSFACWSPVLLSEKMTVVSQVHQPLEHGPGKTVLLCSIGASLRSRV